jgi:hypothetical protein
MAVMTRFPRSSRYETWSTATLIGVECIVIDIVDIPDAGIAWKTDPVYRKDADHDGGQPESAPDGPCPLVALE